MSERKPVKGEVWTDASGRDWECIDADADPHGYCGWRVPNGVKMYADPAGLIPPKPQRPSQTKGWRTVHQYCGIGGLWFALPTACHAHALRLPDEVQYLGALNLETGEWVPRP